MCSLTISFPANTLYLVQYILKTNRNYVVPKTNNKDTITYPNIFKT